MKKRNGNGFWPTFLGAFLAGLLVWGIGFICLVCKERTDKRREYSIKCMNAFAWIAREAAENLHNASSAMAMCDEVINRYSDFEMSIQPLDKQLEDSLVYFVREIGPLGLAATNRAEDFAFLTTHLADIRKINWWIDDRNEKRLASIGKGNSSVKKSDKVIMQNLPSYIEHIYRVSDMAVREGSRHAGICEESLPLKLQVVTKGQSGGASQSNKED